MRLNKVTLHMENGDEWILSSENSQLLDDDEFTDVFNSYTLSDLDNPLYFNIGFGSKMTRLITTKRNISCMIHEIKEREIVF